MRPGMAILLLLLLGQQAWRAGHSPSLPDPSVPHYDLGERVDLNTADAPRLALLPDIGPMRAERICRYREAQGEFLAVSQVEQVQGVGPAIRRGLEPYAVTAGSVTSSRNASAAE